MQGLQRANVCQNVANLQRVSQGVASPEVDAAISHCKRDREKYLDCPSASKDIAVQQTYHLHTAGLPWIAQLTILRRPASWPNGGEVCGCTALSSSTVIPLKL